MADRLLDLRLRELLDVIADSSSEVASGAVAATTAAAAAGLVTMAARRSASWSGGSAIAGQSEVLRTRASALMDETAEAYGEAASRLHGEPNLDESGGQRDWQLGQALRRAADAPLAVAEVAADICFLAADVARSCDQAVRPDVVAACALAESAASAAADLVTVNLASGADDPRSRRAGELAAFAGKCRADLVQLS